MPEVLGRPMVALVVLVVLIAVWVLCVFRMPEVVESAAVDYVAGL